MKNRNFTVHKQASFLNRIFLPWYMVFNNSFGNVSKLINVSTPKLVIRKFETLQQVQPFEKTKRLAPFNSAQSAGD